MAQEVIAADTSPLIGLASAGGFELLRELYGSITIATSVRREVLARKDRPGAAELRAGIRDGWVKVARDPAATARFPDLGSGEAATLALAIGNRDKYLIIMDDPVGRARAKSLNLPVTGVAGVLLAAENAGLIEVVRPYLDRLAAEGFRLSSELAHSVLEEAGEG